MKPVFTDYLIKPRLASMIQEPTAAEAVARIRNSIYDGAEVIALHLEFLGKEHHNLRDLRNVFAYAGSLPVYTMNYRNANRPGVSDEELVAGQLIAAEAGASMVDVMGDIYDPSPMQLTKSPEAIERQRRMIEQFHGLDCQVMLSSHTWAFMTAEQTLEHCNELISRGADMVKIAMCAFREEQMDEVYRTTLLMRRELKVPFLHVCMGQYGKVHRMIAPLLGSSLALCMQQYIPVCNKEQPLLRAAKAVFDNIDRGIARNDQLGCYVIMPDERS